MALFLIHKTLEGEPVGIFSEVGDVFYQPGFEQLQKQGEQIVGYKGTSVPWDVFVEEKTRSANHRFWWGSVDDDRIDLEEILLDARSQYQSQ